jgi:hypothetical protein
VQPMRGKGVGGRMKKQKEPFKFSYNRPSLDWFETINVTIEENDYYYYRLERRYGPTWWLIGMYPPKDNSYEWVNAQLGEIRKSDLLRFIEWAKKDDGSRVIEIKVISGDFDIFEELKELIKND